MDGLLEKVHKGQETQGSCLVSESLGKGRSLGKVKAAPRLPAAGLAVAHSQDVNTDFTQRTVGGSWGIHVDNLRHSCAENP